MNPHTHTHTKQKAMYKPNCQLDGQIIIKKERERSAKRPSIGGTRKGAIKIISRDVQRGFLEESISCIGAGAGGSGS